MNRFGFSKAGLDAVGLNAQLCRAPGGEQIKKNST